VIELIIKKLIEAANKKREVLDVFETKDPFSVNTSEIKPVASTPAVNRHKGGRVFGIFPSLILCAAIALIPLWKFIWPDDPVPGFQTVINDEYFFEMQIPEGMQEFSDDPDQSVIAFYSYPETPGEFAQTIRVIYTMTDEEKTSEEWFDEYQTWYGTVYADLNFQMISTKDQILDGEPARAFIFEYDAVLPGESVIRRVRTKEVITVKDGDIWGLSLYDDIADFDQSLVNFKVSEESFNTW